VVALDYSLLYFLPCSHLSGNSDRSQKNKPLIKIRSPYFAGFLY
jgi:hypothetical protein